MFVLRPIFSLLFLALASTRVVLAYPWPVDPPRPLYNAYGDFQSYPPSFPLYYLHPAIDIQKPLFTEVRAIQGGSVVWIKGPYEGGRLSDVLLCDGNYRGWVYAHLDAASVDTLLLGDWIPAGRAFGLIGEFAPGGLPSHLHLEADSILTDLDIYPPPFYPIYNPLDSLAYDPDNQTPIVVHDDFLPVMDESYGQGHMVFPKKDTINAFLVNHKVDFSVRVRDTVYQGDQVGIYRIYYEIFGPSYQGPRGFVFELSMFHPTMNFEGDFAQLAAERVYNTESSTNRNGRYLVSNTQDTTYLTNSFRDITRLVGYWNTKRKCDGAPGDTATSNAEAQFPDDFYQVKVTVQDNQPNTKEDTLSVVVNNFPPLIKQTYPDSGGVNFVSGDSIRIWFDQPMDTASAKSAFHLQLKGSGSDVVGDTLFSGDTLLIFVPSDTLRLDTVYVVRIDSTAKDIADSMMLHPYSFPFSTQRTVLLFTARTFDGCGPIGSLFQQDSVASESIRNYDIYPIISPKWIATGPRLCYDAQGNNFIIHWTTDLGVDCVSKFSYTGEDSLRFLIGRKFRSITTDGDSLYLLQRSPSDTSLYQYILKTSLSGDSGSCFLMDSTNGWTAGSVWYSPWDSLLYVTWGEVHKDSAFVRRYRRNGQREGNDLYTPPNAGLRNMIVVNDRVAMIRCYYWQELEQDTYVTFHRLSDWNNPFTVELNSLAPRIDRPAYSNVWGATATPDHLYLSVESYDGQFYDWVARFDRDGNFVDSFLILGPYTYRYGAMAAFPSVLRNPQADYSPPSGPGIGDGGPQTADANSLLPRVYALGLSYPNPAEGGLRIDYTLPKESHVNLRIYNVAGQLVRSLREGKEKPGFYKAEWDGKDQNGHRVTSGVYLYRMEAGEFKKTRKLVVLR
jgi:hypothetical protein